MMWFTTPDEDRGYEEFVAWFPVKAIDEYSGREAWIWLRCYREFPDGRRTFSSFWI